MFTLGYDILEKQMIRNATDYEVIAGFPKAEFPHVKFAASRNGDLTSCNVLHDWGFGVASLSNKDPAGNR
jgi:hypothetical protein